MPLNLLHTQHLTIAPLTEEEELALMEGSSFLGTEFHG